MERPRFFYYITDRDRLKPILKDGILSRSRSQPQKSIWSIRRAPEMKSIHDEDVIQIRKSKTFKNRSLWDYANLYFQVRNPMLYRVTKQYGKENIIVLQISSDIINSDKVGITDGNAASSETQFFENVEEGLRVLDLEQLNRTYWTDSDDAKRTIMAELLVYDCIPKEKIISIHVANENIADGIRKEFVGPLNIISNPDMFFLPEDQNRISDSIILARGDMFFSEMQTFTISVNTVGVMGKGLASRTKYQFPDVYVHYQDLCRQKILQMGKPVLYKRKGNLVQSLSEDTKSLITENGHRWFLLFPTKNHWKTNSPIEGIEKGLQWLLEHYKDWQIESIALPSLGCGLGGLNWKEVGPLMCKYLCQMEIKSYIYLPAEGEDIPKEQLKPQFLLHS